MTARSIRADVRNPLVRLPAARAIQGLPDAARAALRDLLSEIQADAKARANEAWRRHKAPMAAYWKAVSVYAGHAKRLTGKPVDRLEAAIAGLDGLLGDELADLGRIIDDRLDQIVAAKAAAQ